MIARLAVRIEPNVLAHMYRLGDTERSRPKERPIVAVGDD